MNLNDNNHPSMNEEQQTDFLPTEEEQRAIRDAFLLQHHPVPDIDSEWEALNQQINPPAETHHHLWRWCAALAVAASVALLVLMTTNSHHPHHTGGLEVIASVENVGDVTLTSDDGTEQVVKGTSVSFARKQDAADAADAGSLMTMSTPRGHDCEITLADGTKVWLYGESSIEFPRKFVGKERRVRMKGEAYFDVVKDASHPFVVENDYFSTTVLGTSFSVRAYSEKDATVTLVEGKVRMSGKNMSQQTLRPGQQARYHAEGFSVSEVDTYPVVQRKDGYFYFDNETLLQIMMELGRWYNKTVVFVNEKSMNERFHFVAERKQTLEEVIEALNDMDKVNVMVTDNEITVH